MESRWRLLISHHKDFIQMTIAYFTSYSLSGTMIHPPATTSNGKFVTFVYSEGKVSALQPWRMSPFLLFTNQFKANVSTHLGEVTSPGLTVAAKNDYCCSQSILAR
nr:hypothetical protein [Tanacetum cinerariifolium]